MEEKLKILSKGIQLVNPEKRKSLEIAYMEKINHWRKRKRMFKELWDAITENSPKDLKELKVFVSSLLFFFIYIKPYINRRSWELNMTKMLA